MKKSQHTVYEEDLFVEVIVFYKAVTSYMNDTLPKDNQLSLYELFFITHLDGLEEGTTCYDLAKKFPFDSSYINKVIKRLEEKGMIIKTQEGKKKQITLSEKSKLLLVERPKLKENFIELLDKNNITDEQLNDFIIVLKKLVKILDENQELQEVEFLK